VPDDVADELLGSARRPSVPGTPTRRATLVNSVAERLDSEARPLARARTPSASRIATLDTLLIDQ